MEAARTLASSEYHKGIQKVLNGLRKSESKARKLEEERDDMEAKWLLFQQNLTDSYLEERAKYREKADRLHKEIAEQE